MNTPAGRQLRGEEDYREMELEERRYGKKVFSGQMVKDDPILFVGDSIARSIGYKICSIMNFRVAVCALGGATIDQTFHISQRLRSEQNVGFKAILFVIGSNDLDKLVPNTVIRPADLVSV